MTEIETIDRRLAEALGDLAEARVPDYKNDVLARTSRMRQRPAWTFLERWTSMTTIAWPARSGRALPSTSRLIILAALMTGIVAGTFLVGTALLRSDALLPAPTTGLAKNGLIAFDHGWDIWVVDPDGTHPRAFVEDPEFAVNPTWSPDGTRLAYWAVVPPEGTDDILAGRGSLIVVDADGGGRTALVESVRVDPIAAPPAWSPDGASIAYSFTPESGSSESSIATIPSDGGTPTVLVERGISPSWSPDGTAIAYKGVNESGKAGVHVLKFGANEDLHVSSGNGAFRGYDFALPQWSPDGTRLMYYSGPGQPDVRVAMADGSGDIAIVETSDAGGMDTWDGWPAWLPDGLHITYFSPTHSPSGWVVADMDGTNRVPLLGRNMTWAYPTVVSPDGSKVVAFDSTKHIQLVDLSGQAEPIEVDVDSTFLSSSWQRLPR